ncbi:hypothetical protein Btru_047584 [Bulinus truncatus]|nr:hypothetical protein Btru_047584 [Bulinus truncatus]
MVLFAYIHSMIQFCPLFQYTGDVSRGNESLGDVSRGNESLGDVSRGNESLVDVTRGDVSRGNESLGDVSRGNESLGDVSRGNESLGDVSRGNESLGDVSRGNESLGDVSRGNESLGDVSRGNESLVDVSRVNESLGDVSRGNESLSDVSRGNESLRDVSRGNESLVDVSRVNESLGDVSRVNESLGDVSRGNESLGDVSRGDVSRGNESLGDVSRGNESLGDVSRGNESLGDVSRGNESLGDVSRAWYTMLEATPNVILPKGLQVRCSIKKYFNLTEKFNGNASRQSVPAGFHFDQLLSVVISKVNNANGENETIASVTGCSTPVMEKSFLNLAQAEGSTERSPEKDEQGYLYLTWNNPNEKHAAKYTCEVLFLNSDKHSSVLSTSLDIVSVEPTIADLVNYISDSEKTIQQVTRQINELQANYTELRDVVKEHDGIHTNLSLTSTIINNKLEKIKGQNSQFGEINCLVNEVNHVRFTQPFNNAPKVNLILSYLYVPSGANVVLAHSLYYVNRTSFGVHCNRPSSLTSINFKWLALDL